MIDVETHIQLVHISWKTLNNSNKLNVALGLMHLQFNAYLEKKIQFFFIALAQ
jgi:hypothetical protein